MLMPGTNEIVGGGKDGRLWRAEAGQTRRTAAAPLVHDGTNPPVQYFRPRVPGGSVWLSWFPFLFNVGYHHNHGSPVYWNSRSKGPTIYLWPEEDNVRAFHYDAAQQVPHQSRSRA